jgi:thiol:disulfide interchange protein DsbC
MVKGTAPVKNTCDNPIESNAKLANDLGVAGTPTIYLNNGNQTQNPQELLAAMKEKK